MTRKPVKVSCRVSGCGSTDKHALLHWTSARMTADQLTHMQPTTPYVLLTQLLPNHFQVLHDAGTIRVGMTHQGRNDSPIQM